MSGSERLGAWRRLLMVTFMSVSGCVFLCPRFFVCAARLAHDFVLVLVAGWSSSTVCIVEIRTCVHVYSSLSLSMFTAVAFASMVLCPCLLVLRQLPLAVQVCSSVSHSLFFVIFTLPSQSLYALLILILSVFPLSSLHSFTQTILAPLPRLTPRASYPTTAARTGCWSATAPTTRFA